MPAVARRESPSRYHEEEVVAAAGALKTRAHAGAGSRARAVTKAPAGKVAPAGKRWHDEQHGEAAGSRAAASSTRARAASPRRQQTEEETDWRGLVDHFGGEHTAQIAIDRTEIAARQQARRHERLKHRPFRMTLLATALAGAPLALLACLLWMKSNALALSREEAELHNSIVAARFELQSTRKEIASVNASPQVEHWARERGWRQATQQDFDDVSKVIPLQPVNAASIEVEDVAATEAAETDNEVETGPVVP